MDEHDDVQSSEQLLRDWVIRNSRGNISEASSSYDDINSITFALSGCFRLRLNGTNEFVAFVTDHKKLWNYYCISPPSSSNGDSFGAHALLFEGAVMFLFEKRMIQFMKFMAVYHVLMFVLIILVQPELTASMSGNIVMSYVILQAYCQCSLVYKPTIDSDIMTTYDEVRENDMDGLVYTPAAVESSLELALRSSEHSFSTLAMHYYGSLCREIGSVFGTQRTGSYLMRAGRTANADGDGEFSSDANPVAHQPPSHGRDTACADVEKGGAGAGAGRNSAEVRPFEVEALQGAEASLSVKNAGKLSINQQLRKHSSETYECAYYLLLSVGSRFLSSTSREEIKVSFWVRHSMLLILVCFPLMVFYNIATTMLAYTCVFPNSYEQAPWFVGLNCTSQYIVVLGTLGGLTIFLNWSIAMCALLISVIGMMHGSVIMHNLARNWVRRYVGLRQCRLDDEDHRRRMEGHKQTLAAAMAAGAVGSDSVEGFTIPDDAPANCDSTAYSNCKQEALRVGKLDMLRLDKQTYYSRSLLIRGIEADAYENYLFIQEYVKQVSGLWSEITIFVVLLSFMMAAYCIIYTLYFMSRGTFPFVFALSAPVFLFTGLFPIYCLAYANAAIDTIQTSFKMQCTPTNYEVIGGRELWIQYLQESPAYWTLFGFAITWNVLYSIVGSIIGSIALGAMSFLGRSD